MNNEMHSYDIIIQGGQLKAQGSGRGDVTEEYIPDDNIMYLKSDINVELTKKGLIYHISVNTLLLKKLIKELLRGKKLVISH